LLDYNTARVFHFAGSAKNTQIYSKTICIEPKRHLPLVRCTEWGAGNAQGTRFFNIIFYVDGRVTCDWDKSSVTVFENNIFGGWHVEPPLDSYAIPNSPQRIGAIR
jgi:hypothetical protein